jgi:hypothetical protein
MIHLLGKRFGRLLVINQTTRRGKNGGIWWLCKCDCGDEKEVDMTNLINGHVKSCGCLQKESRYREDTGLRYVISVYKRNAKTRNLIWKLTQEQVESITKKNCFYCGRPPERESLCSSIKYIYNGIDRVDSSVGYTENNCVSCCWSCNARKSNFSAENMKKSLEFLGYKIIRIDDEM